MPDHWQGLVELGPMDHLSSMVGRIKGSTARALNQARNATGNIWSEGFHDHAIRDDEDVAGIARYIVMNPVRAGLVRSIGQYPFWDAIWLASEGTCQITQRGNRTNMATPPIALP